MQKKQASEYKFDLTGGNLCLNLANTISHRGDAERQKEHLESYVDIIAFARQSGIVSLKQGEELVGYAKRHSRDAGRSFRKVIELREAVYRTFLQIAQGKSASAADLKFINDCAVEALQKRRLSRVNESYRWEWQRNGPSRLDCVLWPMSQAAADLLTSEELRSVRLCEAPDCDWLFLDHSRNRSRRWCDMTVCGNRQKARRHYQRTHQE